MSNNVINPYQQFLDDDGQPVANGTIDFNVDESTTLGTIYSNEALTVTQANPYTLDANGCIAGDVKYTGKRRLVLKDADGAHIRTMDNVGTIGDTSNSIIPFATMAAAVAATDIYEGAVLQIADKFNTTWDAVLSSGVTENTFDTVQCSGINTLSLVQRDGKIVVPTALTSAAINAALALIPSGGVVYCPSNAGTWVISTEVRVSTRDTFIYFGEGALVNIAPAAAALVAFRFENTELYPPSIPPEPQDGKIKPLINVGILGSPIFYSADTTYKKTIVKVVDCSTYVLDKIRTQSPHVQGASSIGFDLYGREHGRIIGPSILADFPIKLNNIPADHYPGGIGIDHHNFHDCYLLTNTTNPVISAADGLILSNVSFTGYQSWIGSGHGFYWNDTTSTGVNGQLSFDNVRTEQGSTGYDAFHIVQNYELQGLTFNNCRIGDRENAYLRKCSNVTFNEMYHTSTLRTIDADATVKEIHGNNCFWQAASTATLAGQQLVYATPKYPNTAPLSPTFHYTLASNTARASYSKTTAESATRTGFTEVLGGGAITSTVRLNQVGNLVFGVATITCTGGATIASVAGTSLITSASIPSFSQVGLVSCSTDGPVDLGNGVCQGVNVFLPAFAARTGVIYIGFTGEVA